MYERRYGLIRTLAPLHVGASAGEEAGNLNLIFRDPFTQTGIIPGSSIRGRFRAEMRQANGDCDVWYGKAAGDKDISEGLVKFEYASSSNMRHWSGCRSSALDNPLFGSVVRGCCVAMR
jgi:CRISPR-associated protein Cmr4